MACHDTTNFGMAAMPAGMPTGLPRLRTRQAPRGKTKQVPTPVPMGGKPWYHGDPHERYRFVRVLGTGHFAAVYLCSRLSSGELVAIKALDKHHPEYERHTALEEVRVLAALQACPGVVGLVEVWEDGAYLFIVQEACLGGELFDRVVRQHAFSERDASRCVAAVLDVVRHAHSRNVLLRDLKPENWLLRRAEEEVRPDNLRVVDFGLSVFHHPTAPCTDRVGSSYYVAPEVLAGSYSFPADLWSLGVMTYVLLSGFPPFWGSSDPVIFHHILHDDVDFDYEPWHNVSAAAKDFIARLLVKDPAARMDLATAAAHPWVADAGAAPSAPLLPQVLDRLAAFTKQTRLRKLLLAVVARQLSEGEIGALRGTFAGLDTDGDGLVSAADVVEGMRRAGVDVGDADLARTLEELGPMLKGSISAEEFVAAALDTHKVLTAKTINAIFAELDRDADGLLAVEELAFVLEECNIDVEPDLLRRLMHREGALDKKGMISAVSFKNLLLGNPEDSNSDDGEALGRGLDSSGTLQNATSLSRNASLDGDGLLPSGHLDAQQTLGASRAVRTSSLRLSGPLTSTPRQGLAPIRIESYLRDVHRFAAAGAFKKLAMLVIARQLDGREVAALKALFERLDPCGSGVLTLDVLRRELGDRVAEADLEALVEVLDLKHTGTHIDFDEFLAAALEDQHLVTETKMRAAFDYFDRDAHGVITAGELGEVLREVGMDDANVSAVLESAVPEGAGREGLERGTVTYQDFRRVLLSQGPNMLTAPCTPQSQASGGATGGGTTPSAGPGFGLGLADEVMGAPVLGQGTSPIAQLAEMLDAAWTPRLATGDDLACSPRHTPRSGESFAGTAHGPGGATAAPTSPNIISLKPRPRTASDDGTPRVPGSGGVTREASHRRVRTYVAAWPPGGLPYRHYDTAHPGADADATARPSLCAPSLDPTPPTQQAREVSFADLVAAAGDRTPPEPRGSSFFAPGGMFRASSHSSADSSGRTPRSNKPTKLQSLLQKFVRSGDKGAGGVQRQPGRSSRASNESVSSDGGAAFLGQD